MEAILADIAGGIFARNPDMAKILAAGGAVYDCTFHPVGTIDATWFATYCTMELDCDFPIIEALGAYWRSVITAFDRFKSCPHEFPWEEYDDTSLHVCILRADGLQLKHITDPSPQMCEIAVHSNGHALQYVPNQTLELCWTAINKAGLAIQHVRDYSALLAAHPDLPMVVVKNSGYAIRYIVDWTPELCLAAVTKDGAAIQHIRRDEFPEHYDAFCMAALAQNRGCLHLMDHPSPAVVAAANRASP